MRTARKLSRSWGRESLRLAAALALAWSASLPAGAGEAGHDEASPRPLPAAKPPLEWEARATAESLDNGYSDWRTLSLDWSRGKAGSQTFYGSWRQTERFSLTDQEFALGLYQPLGGRRTLLVEASGSPTHRVLPMHSLLVQGIWPVKNGWVVSLGGRTTRYSSATSNGGVLSLERYWGSYRGGYFFNFGHTSGVGASTGHRVELSYYPRERDEATLRAGFGREVESLGEDRVLTANVTSVSLGLRHWFHPTWALTGDLGWTRQGDRYTRKGVSLGVRHSFR